MSPNRSLVPALILAAVLAGAGTSRAQAPETVATAPAATSGAPPTAQASVAEQIDTYLKTSPAAALPRENASGVTSGDEPRKVHGLVDVAVGTNGYRSAFVQSDIPVGKTGTLSIAVGESRFNGRVGGAYGGRFAPGERQTLGLGFRMDDTAYGPDDLRCRQAVNDRPDPRADLPFDPRACRPAGALAPPQ